MRPNGSHARSAAEVGHAGRGAGNPGEGTDYVFPGSWYQGALGRENKGVGIRFQRNNLAERAVAADGAGRTAFRGMTSFQPAPLLNLVVPRGQFRILKRLVAFQNNQRLLGVALLVASVQSTSARKPKSRA